MNIEIKLDDPKRCNGCPMIDHTGDPLPGGQRVSYCSLLNEEIHWKEENTAVLRPQECIDKHGK